MQLAPVECLGQFGHAEPGEFVRLEQRNHAVGTPLRDGVQVGGK